MEKKITLDMFGVKKHELTLPNGLHTIFIAKPFAPINARLLMQAGTVFNSSDNGLAHFTEHVIVGQSERYPTKEDISGIIDGVGGYTNAYTTMTELAIKCEVAVAEHLPKMKEHFVQTVGNFYLTPTLLTKEKGVITSEISRHFSFPKSRAARYASSIMAAGTPWSYATLGTIEAIQGFTLTDIEEFYRSYCVLENMLLVIAGGCTLDAVIQTFGDIKLPSGQKSILPPDPMLMSPNKRVFYEMDTDQADVELVFQVPGDFTRETAVLNFALGYAHDGLTSRFAEIRNHRGLAYSVFVRKISFNNLQYIGTGTGVPNEKINDVIDAIIEHYEGLLQEGIPQECLNEKIKTFQYSTLRNLERSVDWVEEFSKLLDEDYRSLYGEFPGFLRFLETISSEEVSAVLKKYINLNNFHLFIAGRNASMKYF